MAWRSRQLKTTRRHPARIAGWRHLGDVLLIVALGLSHGACSSDQERDTQLDLAQQRQLAGPKVGRWLAEAQQALHRGSYSLALALADSAETYAPKLADAPFMLGRILTEMNRYKEAEGSYRRVTKLDSNYRGVWLNLGNIAYRSGRPRTALAHYERECERHPSPQVDVLIGTAYDELNLPDSAQVAFLRAIERDSTFALAYAHLAQLHNRNGTFDEAVRRARQAVQFAPHNPHFRFFLGHALLQKGEADHAVSVLQPVADGHAWFRAAHYDLARALEMLGRQKEARTYAALADSLQELERRIETAANQASLHPDDATLWAELGDVLSGAGRIPEALNAYFKAIHLAPDRMEWQHKVAKMEVEAGRISQAIMRYWTILTRDSTLSDVWVDLGIAYESAGRSDLAEQAWTEALKQDPGHRIAKEHLDH